MRFVWAVTAFVLAALLIGAGIAQRTLFLGPSTQEQTLSVQDETAPFTLVDGAVLRSQPGLQTLIVRGDGELFAAYGRTEDMEAWLADARYNAIALDDEGEPVARVVEPAADGDAADESAETDRAEDAATPEAAEETPARNPAGSDLWLDSFSDEDQLISDTQLPEGTSLLIARDGTAPAPDDILVSWPLDNSTPWAGPLVASGIVLLLGGVVLYILAIRHQRRGRGPRRKGPGPLPPTEPIELAAPPRRDALENGDARDNDDAPAAGRDGTPEDGSAPRRPEGGVRAERVGRATSRRGRRFALPALALTAAVALAGCSADSWPQFGAGTPSPSPSPTVIAPENQKPPAVTEAQAARILSAVSETLATADAERDVDLAATRLDGIALQTRRTDYTLRGKLADRAAPAAIPTDSIEVLLPQASDGWPRTVLMLTKNDGDDTAAPVILTMTQADPWSNYKVTDMAEMHASVQLPEVAPAWLGTTLVPPDSTFLAVAPGEVAGAFADVVDAGEASDAYGSFDQAALDIAQAIRESRQSVVDGLKAAGAEKTSKTAFDIAPSEMEPMSLATLDSGAIVAASFVETQKITPTSEDATIRFGDNPEVTTLTGAKEASKGVITRYALQMFFSVPTQGSSEQIRLLAVHQDILNAEVIKK